MLYRPGLFLWVWAMDVLFRPDRFAQHLFLIGVTCVAFFIMYSIMVKECGKKLAFALSLFAFTCRSGGNLLYVWPHISGYLIALTCYSLAANFLAEENLSFYRALLTSILFFVAETFHEFVAVTLLVLILIEIIIWRKSDKINSNTRLLTLLVPLSAYTTLVLIAYINFHPPSFFSLGDVESITFGKAYLYQLGVNEGNILKEIVRNMVPLPSNLRFGFGVLGIIILLASYRRWLSVQRRTLVYIVPVITLLAGLFVGRVATRGHISGYYFEIFQYLLVLALATQLKSLRNLLPAKIKASSFLDPACLVILLWSSMASAQLMGRVNASRPEIVPTIVTSAREIRHQLNAKQDLCYAGLYDPLLRTGLNEALNITLLDFSCGRLKGSPQYFKASDSGDVTAYFPTELNSKSGKSIRLKDSIQSDELAPYLKGLRYNFREALANRGHTGEANFRWSGLESSFSYVAATFQTQDRFPEMYNVGLAIRRNDKNIYFLFKDNFLKVLIRDPQGTVEEAASSQLMTIRPSVTMRLLDIGQSCLVFQDALLLTQIGGHCLENIIDIGTFSIDNDSPPDELRSLTYSTSPRKTDGLAIAFN